MKEAGTLIKEHGNEADFPRFLHKLVRHRSRRFDFGFEFAKIFVIDEFGHIYFRPELVNQRAIGPVVDKATCKNRQKQSGTYESIW